jgi:hypothetical protein
MTVLLLDGQLLVGRELGDEMEISPLVQELKDCGIHIVTAWSRSSTSGGGGASGSIHFENQPTGEQWDDEDVAVDAVLLGPGIWNFCTLNEYWPHSIDLFMAGSIRPVDDHCDWTGHLLAWDPSLVVVREPLSLDLLNGRLPGVTTTTSTTTIMSGDLSHSYQPPLNSTLNYWETIYEQLKEKILIFIGASNIAKIVVNLKGGSLELSTFYGGTVTVPVRSVIFATSSSNVDDLTGIQEWRQNIHSSFKEHQFVQYQTAEQLCALISHSTQVYTDQYRPGVLAHRLNRPVTVLHRPDGEHQETELVGLVQLLASPQYNPGSRIREDYNAKAFRQMRATLRRLRNRSRVPMRNTNSAVEATPLKQEMKQSTTNEQPFAIVVGLPKSGTTSLYHFFSCSGYHTTHYCCCGTNATEFPCAGGRLFNEKLKENLDAGLPLWHGTARGGGGDHGGTHHHQIVHAQLDGESKTESYFLPQHYYLKELHDSAPEAIWILPLRPAPQWKASALKWLDMSDRLRIVYEREEDPNNAGEAFDLERFYNHHTETIRDFCHNHRMDSTTPPRCVEVEIDDPNAGQQLAKHFPNTLPSCWGKHNAGPFFQTIPMP